MSILKADIAREGVNGPEALACAMLTLAAVAAVIFQIAATIDHEWWGFVLASLVLFLAVAALLAVGNRVDLRRYETRYREGVGNIDAYEYESMEKLAPIDEHAATRVTTFPRQGRDEDDGA